MHIYIDESGSFIPRDSTVSQASAVVGLVVPSERRVLVFREFKKLRKKLRPGDQELKGSSIDEKEAAAFCGLLRKHNLLVEAIATDMGTHTNEKVSKFKNVQAERILESLSREHHSTVVEEAWTLHEEIRHLPNQLFVQAFCSIQLVRRLFEKARTYHALRSPRELASYTWRVDAKNTQVTAMEHAWALLALVVLTNTPIGMIPGGDYSYDEEFAPRNPVQPQFEREHGQIDLTKMIRDRMTFADSRDDLGIQMADICASLVTRALNGKLQPSGWMGLSSSFVRERDKAIHVIMLDPDAPKEYSRLIPNHVWHPTLRAFASNARPMITRELQARVQAGFRALEGDSSSTPDPSTPSP